MPALTFPTADFVAFTKILSSEVNGKFNAIKTLLNTTKLDYQNLQLGAVLASTQTSMQVVTTSSAGLMTTQAYVNVGQGGFGFSYTLTSVDAAKVLQLNSTGAALTFDVVPQNPVTKIYSFYRFG